MYLYLIAILLFLFINYLISILIKKYTYEKFFIYVIIYFFLTNFINLIYLQNIDFFTFQALFSVFMLFLYSGLYRSISVKVMICLYFKKRSVNVNSFYRTEFKKNSFDKRIKILINNGFLVKKNKHFMLSPRGKKFSKIFKIVKSIYRIKFSG